MALSFQSLSSPALLSTTSIISEEVGGIVSICPKFHMATHYWKMDGKDNFLCHQI